MRRPTVIEFDNVVWRAGKRRILDGINLALDPGLTVLVGRNGAGKTSMMRILCGATTPSAGRVLRDGVDVFGGGSHTAHQRKLGWLPQDARVHPRMTVDHFLQYSAWLYEIPQTRACRRRIGDVVDRCDIGRFRKRQIGTLSGGERQRVVLAAVLLKAPPLLVLDEPNSGLDPAQQTELLRIVRELEGVTILLSTHVVDEAVSVADKVVVLGAGEIVKELDSDALAALGSAAGATVRQHVLETVS